jgi:hypothetical protein
MIESNMGLYLYPPGSGTCGYLEMVLTARCILLGIYGMLQRPAAAALNQVHFVLRQTF